MGFVGKVVKARRRWRISFGEVTILIRVSETWLVPSLMSQGVMMWMTALEFILFYFIGFSDWFWF